MNTNKNNTIFFQRLKSLYQKMDQAWQNIALQYNFQCNGCKENCCETQFYHHTYIEKEYLHYGLAKFFPKKIKTIQKRAKLVMKQWQEIPPQGESLRIMCPLNETGKCILYPYRPMICRLHGIPHEMRRPGGHALRSPGCNAGTPIFDKIGYIPFDRTPFYKKMATIEMDYRKTAKKTDKIKQTIAEILATMETD